MSLIKTLASHYRQNILAARHGARLPQAFGAHPAAVTGSANNFSIRAGTATYHTAPKTEISDASLAQEQPSERSPFASWFRWALGSLLTMVLPIWDNKWKTLLSLEGEVEMAAEMVESAADAVEKIATMAEKMASDAAENLPEDGKLKGAALFVEHASKEVAEEAHLAKDIVHKVDEVKHEVEMFIQPIVHHTTHRKLSTESKVVTENRRG